MNSEQVLIRLWRSFLLVQPIFSYNYALLTKGTIGIRLRVAVPLHLWLNIAFKMQWTSD